MESGNGTCIWSRGTLHIGRKSNNFGYDTNAIYIGGNSSKIYIKGKEIAEFVEDIAERVVRRYH